MPDWFDFAGARSTSKGVYVLKYPPITLPSERAEFKPVPGRSGTLTILEGDAVYDDITLSINCVVRDLSRLDGISAWLKGDGLLVLGNMPSRAYEARAVNQVELTKVLTGREHRTFAAVFRCKPYRYVHPAPASQPFASSGYISNPGNADAEPLIQIVGSGDITLTIGDATLTITELPSAITIDVAAGTAFDTNNPDIGLTGICSPDKLIIRPGLSTVSWTGNVTGLKINGRWRYL